uniref:B cell linker n=1 Tax=Sinocyclocheilus rhinocerous TaxID=307959 RepID=A0A673GJV2_9TELE
MYHSFHEIIVQQLQKIVQDIKKNDDSLFNRLKRSMKNLLYLGLLLCFRIKKKRPPKVPVRDYQGNDTYEDPQGDHDDNYEPPPRLEGHFTVSPSITNPRGEYVDSCRGRPAKPNHPFHMQQRHKPPRPTHRSLAEEDDGDYIEPEDEADDDNYIDPTEKTLRSKMTEEGLYFVNMMMVYVCFKQEPQSEDEYEVCEADDSVSEGPEEATEARRPSMPTPRPRDLLKSPINNCMISVTATSIKTTPVTISRSPPDTMPSPSPTGFHRAKYMPLPRQLPSQSRGTLPSESRSARDAEEEAGVYKKVWYASSCDRKTAEDALLRSAKDSSFLLRKSSGVDAQQPYTLVVFYNSRVYNIPVRYIASTKQYALGKEKQGEERFSSVSDIIENHQKNPLVLVDSQSNTKDSTKLRHAVKP